MNMNEKDIDHLTRKLMRGTAEQPSASLSSRIMALIMQEKKRVYKYYIKKRFTPVGIFSMFVAYMLVLVGILYLVKSFVRAGGNGFRFFASLFPDCFNDCFRDLLFLPVYTTR